MSRNVNNTMNKIIDRLKSFITNENRYRISTSKRHIEGAGKEQITVDFVKNAKLLTENFSTSICVIHYDDKNYIVTETSRGTIFEKLDFNIINSEDNSEIFQGAGMLAIAFDYLSFRKDITEQIILDECLSFNDKEDEIFSFCDIANFFEEYMVYEISEDIFELKYEEDFQRLLALSLLDNSPFFEADAQYALQNLLLLKGSRSVAATIVNSLLSNQWEYAYLQIYQCLEYLFIVSNALDLSKTYKLNLYNTIDILSDNILKKNEKDSLIGVLTNANNLQKQCFWNKLCSESITDEGELNEKIAKMIYEFRCNVAHLRFKQNTLNCPNKQLFMDGFTLLTYNIFENMDCLINDICLKKSSWKPLANIK